MLMGRITLITSAGLLFLAIPGKAQDSGAATVCSELQARYGELARANEQRDLAAILALRTPDFSTIGPNGQRSTFADMAERSRLLVSAMRPPIRVENTILTLSVTGDTAVVEVLQEFSRRQVIDAVERTVETSVLQRESWRRTSEGWLLAFVDNVHDRRWFVDQKRIDPDKPPDPNAPEFITEDAPRPKKTTDCGLAFGNERRRK